ncbi:MAG: putative signal transducing protein [Actinomycetota bacterium]
MTSVVVGRPFGTDLVDPPADPFEGDGGGSGWIKLIDAPDDIEAHLIVGRLAEAGIETRTLKDRSGPGTWLYTGSNPWAPVTVLVRKLQLEDAQLVLAEVAFAAPPAEPDDSARSGRWWGPVLWWTAAISLGVLFTALGWVQANEQMESCGRPAGCETPARP